MLGIGIDNDFKLREFTDQNVVNYPVLIEKALGLTWLTIWEISQRITFHCGYKKQGANSETNSRRIVGIKPREIEKMVIDQKNAKLAQNLIKCG